MTLLLGAVAILLAIVFAPFLLMLLFSAALLLIDLLIVIPLRIAFFLLTFPFMFLASVGGALWAAASSAWVRLHRDR